MPESASPRSSRSISASEPGNENKETAARTSDQVDSPLNSATPVEVAGGEGDRQNMHMPASHEQTDVLARWTRWATLGLQAMTKNELCLEAEQLGVATNAINKFQDSNMPKEKFIEILIGVSTPSTKLDNTDLRAVYAWSQIEAMMHNTMQVAQQANVSDLGANAAEADREEGRLQNRGGDDMSGRLGNDVRSVENKINQAMQSQDRRQITELREIDDETLLSLVIGARQSSLTACYRDILAVQELLDLDSAIVANLLSQYCANATVIDGNGEHGNNKPGTVAEWRLKVEDKSGLTMPGIESATQLSDAEWSDSCQPWEPCHLIRRVLDALRDSTFEIVVDVGCNMAKVATHAISLWLEATTFCIEPIQATLDKYCDGVASRLKCMVQWIAVDCLCVTL